MSMTPLEIARKQLQELYRDRVDPNLGTFSDFYSKGKYEPVWRWVSPDLSPIVDAGKDNALLLDADLGLGLYFLRFSSDLDIREQICHALRLRSALLPASTENKDASDRLGSWRIALHWYMEKSDFSAWLEKVSLLRGETAHFEEMPIDAIVKQDDSWDSTFASYGFPRALLCVRDLLRKRNKVDVDNWGSADKLVQSLIERFPDSFEGKLEKQFSAEVREKFGELVQRSREDLPSSRPGAVAARLGNIDIKHFRNIERLSLGFPGNTGVSVIQGPNGTGKSSVFEALSLAISGTSFRMEQFLQDKNVTPTEKKKYIERYICPIGETEGSPEVSVNCGEFELKNEPLALSQRDSLELSGTMLSQDESSSLLRMTRSELGAQILGDASKLAGGLRDYVDRRYDDSRRRQQEFLDEWSLNKNIKKLETARLRIAERFLNKKVQMPVSQVAWIRQPARFADQRIHQEVQELATVWQREEESISAWAKNLTDISRSNVDVNAVLKEVVEQRKSRNERTNRVFASIRAITSEWPPAISSDARAWGAWLETQAQRSSENDDRVTSLLKDQKQLIERQLGFAKEGQQASSHVSHLESALTLVDDQEWVKKAGQSCPTCETDFSAQDGISTRIAWVLEGASERVDALSANYREVTAELEGLARQLRDLGAESPPIDAERQGEVLKALQYVRRDKQDDVLILLQKPETREEMCDELMHLEQLPGDIDDRLFFDTGTVAANWTFELLAAFSMAESASDEENAWRAVRSKLSSELAKVVDEHLPTTIQAVWAEIALNLTPLSAQLPGAFSLGVDSKKSEPEATFALKSADGEPRLAQYVLNSAEIRTLGLAWFYLRYLQKGRFDFSFLVLDDPAQEMDQPTFRELCRFWETFTRLHRRLEVPLQLVILLHMDERALDAARATNATLHFLKWNQGKSELLKSTRLFGESIGAPTPEVVLAVEDSSF